MTNTTLTVNLADKHTVIGSRYQAMDTFKREGAALWLRAAGTATLFYSQDGKMRQASWKRFTIGPAFR